MIEQKQLIGLFKYKATSGPNIEEIKYLLKNDTTNFTVVYTIKTKIWSQECLSCDYTDETKFLTNKYCLTCKFGYYFQDSIETICVNEVTKPTNYALDTSVTPQIYKQCHSRCLTCSVIGNSTNHMYASCKVGYQLISGVNGKCLTSLEASSDLTLHYDRNDKYYECTTKWYYTDANEFICVDTCPTINPNVITTSQECVSVCPSPKVLYNKECLDQCPGKSVPNEKGECEFDLFSIRFVHSERNTI